MLAYDWNFLGLSTENKPTAGEKVVDGSTYYECDTSLFYIYYNGEWYQQTFVTEDGINFWLYKALMKKMFGKLFDSNISKGKIIKPTTGTEIEFSNSLPAQITDLTGYGDTFQQTYSGKNLMPLAVSDNTTSRTNAFRISLPAGTYTISFDLSEIELGTNESFTIQMTIAGAKSGGGNYDAIISGTISSTTATYKSFTFTTTADSDINTNSNIRIAQTYWDNGARAKLSNIQIEVGSTPTSYEPYVGGTASPNPDYPQDINVVAGEQTVTINGEQIYTIDLGSIELCKIGDNQDYIYKSGDDWYVHKEISHITRSVSNMTGGNYPGWEDVTEIRSTIGTGINGALSSVTSYMTNIQSADNGVNINTNSSNSRLFLSRSYWGDDHTETYWKTNYPNLVFDIYYVVINQGTDTKITDTTLIANLNSLLNYIFPVGEHQIVITADDLPMALKLTITEKE